MDRNWQAHFRESERGLMPDARNTPQELESKLVGSIVSVADVGRKGEAYIETRMLWIACTGNSARISYSEVASENYQCYQQGHGNERVGQFPAKPHVTRGRNPSPGDSSRPFPLRFRETDFHFYPQRLGHQDQEML